MAKMTNTTFTFHKRNFLHSKLDEVILLWHRAFGQGSFSFSVSEEGNTDFQFGIQLDFDDVSELENSQPDKLQHHGIHGGARRRGRGPARQARDRARAAKVQAAQAAKAASDSPSAAASKFPGEGQVVGKAQKPMLPLPIPNVIFFPPPQFQQCAPPCPLLQLRWRYPRHSQ
jgi:hypothetical protein